VLFYGRASGNAHEAQRLYQEAFPERRLPDHRTLSASVQRLREFDVTCGTCRPLGGRRPSPLISARDRFFWLPPPLGD
jgi:hypothetical protein